MNLAFAVGFGIMFVQAMYINYKMEQSFKKQHERFDKVNKKAEDLHKRLQNIDNNLK